MYVLRWYLVQLQAAMALEDLPHPGARDALPRLQSRGMQVLVLTGDKEAAALRIAVEIGIPRESVKVHSLLHAFACCLIASKTAIH